MKDKNCLIKIQGLSKKFEQPPNGSLQVLVDVSLSIMAGDAIALTGVNGSGKTTLLRILAGDIEPSAGTIWLNEINSTYSPAYKIALIIGRVHQESYKSLASELTVEEVLSIADKRQTRLSLRFPCAKSVFEHLRAFSSEAADFFEQRKKLSTRILSGGQRQLLALATAVLGRPLVLLLDEHMASLDDRFTTLAGEMVRNFIRDSNGAFIAATHDFSWINANTNKVVNLENGQLTVGVKPEI
jgi:putative ABC transport system ATP-binding protein